jgi:hypothetical protein
VRRGVVPGGLPRRSARHRRGGGAVRFQLHPNATNTNSPPPQCGESTDRGLYQINSCYHPEVTDACAFDAQCNADAAYRILSQGTDWTQWATFKNGRYLSFLDEARAAADRLTGSSLPRRPLCYPVTGDWDGNGTDTLGVACKDGNEYKWALMNFNGTAVRKLSATTATRTRAYR